MTQEESTRVPFTFNDSERSIEIHDWDQPSAWLNYLSNGRFHAFVSQAAGGLAWHQSPLIGRLTRYRFSNQPIDGPGFYLYVREKNGDVWSPSGRPAEAALDEFVAEHQPGKTTFRAKKNGLSLSLTLFVAPDSDTLIWDIEAENENGEEREFDLFAYTELSLLEWYDEAAWGCYIKHMLKTWWEPESESLRYLYHHHAHPRKDEAPLLYFSCSGQTTSYSGHRDDFIGGYSGERLPRGVRKGNCGNQTLESGDPCFALQHPVTLAAGKSHRVQFFFGAESGGMTAFEDAEKRSRAAIENLKAPGVVDAQRKKLDESWDRIFESFQCELSDAPANRMINTWNPVQLVHTGRYSRSTSFFAPGFRGMGFRDTCQDMLSVTGRDPQWATRILAQLCEFQFQDGHALHTAYPFEQTTSNTAVHSDDHLWLPFLAHAIASETGELEFLETKAPFFDGSDDTIWGHLMRACQFTEEHLGAHGLPLTLKSDWNDIIGKFAKEGRGESVFAGLQYVTALNYLIELAECMGREEDKNLLVANKQKQLRAIEEHGWDGDFWRRGFDDDGNAVGTQGAAFGEVWLNPQSWAVIAGAGTDEQQRQGLKTADKHLATPVGMRILSPGFETYPHQENPFSGYGPGTGENAAIFCHAHCWAVIASALLGQGNQAWSYYLRMLPENAAKKMGIERYRGEPYAWASNIVGPENNRSGWANVTQCTGTATWMDVAATQYLLGIRPTPQGLIIAPVLADRMEGFNVTRKFRGQTLNIIVNNPERVEAGISKMTLNGERLKLSDDRAPLITAEQLREAGDNPKIVVTMGD